MARQNHKSRRHQIVQARQDACIPVRVADCTAEELSRELLLRFSITSGIEFIPQFMLNDLFVFLGAEIKRRVS